ASDRGAAGRREAGQHRHGLRHAAQRVRGHRKRGNGLGGGGRHHQNRACDRGKSRQGPRVRPLRDRAPRPDFGEAHHARHVGREGRAAGRRRDCEGGGEEGCGLRQPRRGRGSSPDEAAARPGTASRCARGWGGCGVQSGRIHRKQR
ncbi:unnamed protein product, partial [Amoebophrya sp. A120]